MPIYSRLQVPALSVLSSVFYRFSSLKYIIVVYEIKVCYNIFESSALCKGLLWLSPCRFGRLSGREFFYSCSAAISSFIILSNCSCISSKISCKSCALPLLISSRLRLSLYSTSAKWLSCCTFSLIVCSPLKNNKGFGAFPVAMWLAVCYACRLKKVLGICPKISVWLSKRSACYYCFLKNRLFKFSKIELFFFGCCRSDR